MKLIYNAQGQLAELRDAANVLIATYVYRGDGKRAWKELANGTRSYFYYSGEQLIASTNGVDASSLQLWGADGLIGSRNVNAGVTTKLYFLYDTQGNLAQSVDASNGNIVSQSAVTAWGEPLRDAAGNAAGGYGAKFGYIRDGESGFYLCTLRYYDPSDGRWITRDPIGYAGGSNLYGYVGNDPLNGIDPSGLSQDIGGGSGTVRFSLSTYIPYGSVNGYGFIFKGDGRGPSWNSHRYRTQLNWIIDLKNRQVRFSKPQINNSHGVKGNRTAGYVGRGTYDPITDWKKTSCGYEISVYGASSNPYFGKLPGYGIGASPPILHHLRIFLDNNGNLTGLKGELSAFPSTELWSYRGSSRSLDYSYDVRMFPVDVTDIVKTVGVLWKK